MNNNISSQITNHLEFLGYKVEDISDDKIDFLLARSENKSNLFIRITKNDFIFISARYLVSESNKKISEEFLKSLNLVNSRSVFSKWTYEEEKKVLTLQIETFVNGYNKPIFGEVIEIFENEIYDNIKEFWN